MKVPKRLLKASLEMKAPEVIIKIPGEKDQQTLING